MMDLLHWWLHFSADHDPGPLTPIAELEEGAPHEELCACPDCLVDPLMLDAMIEGVCE